MHRCAGDRFMSKRLFDIVTSAMVLVLLGVPLLVIAALIKASSKGPVLYRSRRIGYGGRPFVMHKFRTMRAGDHGPSLTADGDRRVTAVGALLRRWKIDELPQFWNVLCGDMSIIGPRPEVEQFVRHYTRAERGILNVKPGIASMAQLMYWHEPFVVSRQENAEAFYIRELLPRKVAVDLEYERQRTLATDLWLVGQLVLTILRPRVHAALPRSRSRRRTECGTL